MCFLRDLLLLGSLHGLTFKYLYLAHNCGHFNFFPSSVVLTLIVEVSPKKLHLRELASK